MPYKPTLFLMLWDCLWLVLEVSLFLLSLCHCQGQRNHEIAQELPAGHFVFCDTEKIICHHTSKELSCKNRIKYIFTSPTPSDAVILFAVSYFYCPPSLSHSLSHFFHVPLAPSFLLFYLLPNLVCDLIFWCNYLRNDSRAGLHLKAIQLRLAFRLFLPIKMWGTTSCSTRKSWSVCGRKAWFNTAMFTCLTLRDAKRAKLSSIFILTQKD